MSLDDEKEVALKNLLDRLGDKFVREFKFHPKRKWRFDIANPEAMVAIEINGGIWSGGRHVRGRGYKADMEKINAATILGWSVLQYDWDDVINGQDGIIEDVESIVWAQAGSSQVGSESLVASVLATLCGVADIDTDDMVMTFNLSDLEEKLLREFGKGVGVSVSVGTDWSVLVEIATSGGPVSVKKHN